MKQLFLIITFISLSVNTYPQNYDLIVKTKGDSITCRIDSITDSTVYFKIKFKDEWIHTNINLNSVTTIQYKAIKKSALKRNSNFNLPPDDEINISILFFGISAFGPGKDMESGMKDAGLDYKRDDSFLGIKYSEIQRSIIYDIEATYFFKKRSGISFSTGLVDDFKTTTTFPTYPVTSFELKSRIWFYSLTYNFSSKNKRSNFFIGPVLLNHSVNAISNYNIDGKYFNSKKLGFNLGFSYHFVLKDYFFLTLKTSFKWAPDSEIGPYSFQYYDEFGSHEIETVNYPATKLSLSFLDIGLSAGIRIRKK